MLYTVCTRCKAGGILDFVMLGFIILAFPELAAGGLKLKETVAHSVR